MSEPETSPTRVGPHSFAQLGWRRYLCKWCYAPKSMHPRTDWVRRRRNGDLTYLDQNAPQFRPGGGGW